MKFDNGVFDEAVMKHASHLLFQFEDSLETANILTQSYLKNNSGFDLAGYLEELGKLNPKT
ncbi:MAG: hypothetical protein ACLFQV_08920 [Vulcanimicrobiota bacterium]